MDRIFNWMKIKLNQQLVSFRIKRWRFRGFPLVISDKMQATFRLNYGAHGGTEPLNWEPLQVLEGRDGCLQRPKVKGKAELQVSKSWQCTGNREPLRILEQWKPEAAKKSRSHVVLMAVSLLPPPLESRRHESSFPFAFVLSELGVSGIERERERALLCVPFLVMLPSERPPLPWLLRPKKTTPSSTGNASISTIVSVAVTKLTAEKNCDDYYLRIFYG